MNYLKLLVYLIWGLFLLSGCATHYIKPDTSKGLLVHTIEDSVAHHVLFVDKQGRLKDVRAHTVTNTGAYIDAILQKYQEYKAKNSAVRIMLYVHGGLESHQKVMHRAKHTYKLVLEDNIFPIFIGWDSSLGVNMASFLRTHPLQGTLGDMLRSVAYAPFSYLRLYQTQPQYKAIDTNHANRTSHTNVHKHYTKGTKYEQTVYDYLAGMNVLKLISMPVVDIYGKRIYDELLLKIDQLSQRPSALHELLKAIEHEPMQIVAHSMGCIVVNSWLNRYDFDGVHALIYLAAANSIEDIKRDVVPFLKRQRKTEFYLIALHEALEVYEAMGGGSIAVGSLLEYIDDRFVVSENILDKRAGIYRHMSSALSIFDEEVSALVHITRIDKKHNELFVGPTTHESMYYYRYWRKAYWQNKAYERIIKRDWWSVGGSNP